MNENTDDSRWNELIPEAFAEASDPLVRVLLGKMLVVRLNEIGTNDELLSFELVAGRVVRANRKEGLVLSLVGARQGEAFFLHLVPEAYTLIDPGDYALTCGTVVRNPDFRAAFDIYAQVN
ncbi:hypothetical protein [Asticcacaulis sp.]|uniref:hypothetical protein n=1 Tax=Asticcacaulis sp. TaxID=1872648 RepID=UPI0031CDC50F